MPKPIHQEENKLARKNLVRSIVSDLSRGNISLQQGKFITTDDLEQLRRENKKHNFCKQ